MNNLQKLKQEARLQTFREGQAHSDNVNIEVVYSLLDEYIDRATQAERARNAEIIRSQKGINTITITAGSDGKLVERVTPPLEAWDNAMEIIATAIEKGEHD